MMRAWFVLVLLLGCEKAAPRIDRATLWALVPDNAVAGFVITPDALQRIETGYTAVRQVAGLPEMAELNAKIKVIEDRLKKPMTFAALGLSTREAAAVFFVDDRDPIVVVPLADRKRFLELSEGKRAGEIDTIEKGACKIVKDVYACAEKAALLERLGKGRMPDVVQAIGVRGDIEGFVTLPNGPIVGAAVQLSRGGFTVHAAAQEVPAPLRLLLANAQPRIEATTAGFAVVSFGRVLAALGDKVPPQPLVEGVTLDALVKSFAGPLTLTIEHGASTFDLRIPLNDEAPAQRSVAQCDEMEPLEFLGAVVTDDVCHVENEMLNARLDGWVEGKTLRVGDRKTTSPGVRSAISRAAQPLANGEWVVAVLGRGTIFGPTTLKIPPEALPAEDHTSLRVLTLFTEIGFGVRLDGEVVRGTLTVRTLWENPDDVFAKLIAIDLGGIVTGKAAAEAKAIADAAPQSPFAADYQAGMVSLFAPLLVMAGLQEAASTAVQKYVKW